MQHGGEPDAGAEVLGIGGDGDQGLGRDFEQQVIDDRLVLIGNVGDRSRQCEDDMEIRHGQEFSLAIGQPFLGSGGLALRTVPVAAGNGHRPLRVLWGAIGNGELAKAPSGPSRDPEHMCSPLRFGHEQRDQLIRRSKIPFGEMRRTMTSMSSGFSPRSQ